MYQLLKATPDNIRLLLVGDENQLPSIGAGNVLKDLIDSRMIPHTHLKNIHRQGKESQIINNAHRINNGELPDIKSLPNDDFFFIQESDNEYIADTIIELCVERLPGYKNLKPSDIQVITPQHSTEVGTKRLNKRIQAILNKSTLSINHFNKNFIFGDKVMQKVNDYEKNVRNGDIGIISEISLDEDTLTVDYDGHAVTYERSDFNDIELAYAITIHKSQGSEYPCVIIPMTTSHYSMLQRNLLYTAATRGKELVVLVGQKRAIQIAVKNNSAAKRNTLLADRVFETFEDNNMGDITE